MADGKFDLGDYVEVKDRIARFYDLFGQGRLVTDRVELTREPDDKPKVIVYALAYRTPDDPHPGSGSSWMYLPGTTSYTRGSELENTETSAWGRAIGSLGILIDRSIASANEVENKKQPTTEAGRADAANTEALRQRAEAYTAGDWSVSGIASAGKTPPVDGELRQTPDGGIFGFTVETADKKRFQVIAAGPMALPVSLVWDSLDGTEVHVAGEVELVPWSKRDGNGVEKRMPPYRRIHATRIESGEILIPAPIERESHTLETETEAELDAIAESSGLVPEGAA